MRPRLRFRFRILASAAALALLLIGTSGAQASVTYTLNDTTNGVSATATFDIVSGKIRMTVTNTESNTADAGHATSQIQFAVNGTTVSVPTAFVELKGTETNFSGSPTN